jgi:hypothetical protein
MQQIAFHTAMDKYIPLEYRHKIALYVNDMAARANTLEEIFEKSSKVEFGVEEIIFHNYKSNWGHRPHGEYNHAQR